MTIRISSVKDEGMYQVSKWLSHQLLIDVEEMQNLLQALDNPYICITGQIYREGDGILSKDKFLDDYKAYIEGIKSGKLLDESFYRSSFSSVLTKALDHLYQVPLEDGQFLLRVSKPVLQLQAHRMHYSKTDHKFRPMIFGMESISWGIQFSYPQIFQDNQSKEIIKVLNHPDFPNAKLYHVLQKWIRQYTLPTPFLDGDQLINAPIRIGKNCLPWINHHPQLKIKGLKVLNDH